MDYFFVSITGFALGVIVRSLVHFGIPAAAFALLVALVLLGCWHAAKIRAYLFASIFLFAAIIGILRVDVAPQSLPAPFAPLLDTKVSFTGIIVADPDLRDTSQRVTVRVEKDGRSTNILAVLPLYPELSYGEKVKVTGTLESPQPFATDGGRTFRYDHYLERYGIFALMPQASASVIAPPSGVFTRMIGMLYRAKAVFVRGLENALPEPHAALAEGLLAGGKQGLGKALLAAFTISGLVQIVVLSGYNVMIVAEAVLKSLSFLPRRFGYGAAGFGIIAFVIAAGSGSSAVRAGIMACLALYARGSGRSYDALRALAATIVIMALWNPFYLAFDPGFDLSVAATIGLITLTPITEVRLAFVRNAFLREIISTTIAAQIMVLPLLLYETGNLSLVAIPANVLVLPAVPLAMAASFIAGLAGIIVPIAAPVVGIPAYLLLGYILAIGKYAAALPFAAFTLPAFSFALVVVAYAGLAYIAFAKRSSTTVQLRLSKNASM